MITPYDDRDLFDDEDYADDDEDYDDGSHGLMLEDIPGWSNNDD